MKSRPDWRRFGSRHLLSGGSPTPGPDQTDSAKSGVEQEASSTGTRDLGSLIAIVVGFVASRVLYRLAGIRFDTTPVERFWQIVDPVLLQDRLVESLLHLHSQPPLFNLGLGLSLKLFGDHASAALAVVYVGLGLVLTLALHALLRSLGVGRVLSVILTLAFVASPPTVLYENWLFYTYPVATLLCAAAVMLRRFLRAGTLASALGFFALLATVVLTRSLFHWMWYVGIWIVLAGLQADRRKRLVVAGAVPFLVIATWHVTNHAVLGSTAGGTWLGMSLSKTTTFLLPRAERERSVEQGRLSPYALIPPFSDLGAYGDVRAPTPKTGVPILDNERKASGAVNFHNVAYREIGRAYFEDAVRVLRARPGAHIGGWSLSYLICFLPASDNYFLLRNRRQIAGFDRLYSHALCGQIRYAPESTAESLARQAPARRLLGVGWWLLAGYAIAVTYGAGVVRRALAAAPRDAVLGLTAGFLVLNVIWIVGVGNAVELGENNRFRFVADPLCLALLGLFIQDRVSRWRRVGER